MHKVPIPGLQNLVGCAASRSRFHSLFVNDACKKVWSLNVRSATTCDALAGEISAHGVNVAEVYSIIALLNCSISQLRSMFVFNSSIF